MATPEPQNHHFCWNELLTPNSGEARTFFEKLLGWQARDMEVGETVYTIFTKDDKDVCGMMQTTPEMQSQFPPCWLSYIKVDDVVATTESAQSLGATVLLPLKVIPDYGRFSVIQDPTGATLAFWQKD